ncbi:SubName: Full=Uncharacterized protein {ECO:0000313/EMBL:CCA67688.1} [Serendipita indica DSM 11827]|uniref:Uncharacterized protein n=1 Tax=Serendipita indica (strain DSM 11827) TaxID=1109443 RepID=G4T8N6_SERID|nr:SubName: Full=Uncharacterized protein {ECO:0000313/EMBL:CCA67688.1} [Serendipita indica DSM 11827]CCA67688.1 hypothetical protein PIIN_01515 [Serendipita indica DSM 11827]
MSVQMSKEAMLAEIHTLEQALQGEDPSVIVSRHIKLLHDYNESKDAAQALMGKLAIAKGTTVTRLHEKYQLSLRD